MEYHPVPSPSSTISGYQLMNSSSSSSPFGDTTYTKVFVGGLAWETQNDTLRQFFEPFGEILEAVVIIDKNSRRSKGYGFVTFREPEAARKACVDPTPVIDGRRANSNLASLGRPRPPPVALGHTIVMLRAAEMPWHQNESLKTGEVLADTARSLFCLFLFLEPSSRPPYNGSQGSGYLSGGRGYWGMVLVYPWCSGNPQQHFLKHYVLEISPQGTLSVWQSSTISTLIIMKKFRELSLNSDSNHGVVGIHNNMPASIP